jgi:hypothetical protein
MMTCSFSRCRICHCGDIDTGLVKTLAEAFAADTPPINPNEDLKHSQMQEDAFVFETSVEWKVSNLSRAA